MDSNSKNNNNPIDQNMNKTFNLNDEKDCPYRIGGQNQPKSRIPRPKSCNGYYYYHGKNIQFKNNNIKNKNHSSISNIQSRCNSANSMISNSTEKFHLNKNPINKLNRNNNNQRKSFENEKNLETLVSFRRSLKLLGFKLEDFGIEYNDNASELNSSARTSIERPRLQTRVMKRSVSLNDLQNIVQQASLNNHRIIDENQRKTLSKAVYEEWYFNKQKLLKIQKEKEMEKKRQEEEELRMKEEKRKSAEEKFIEWQQKKKNLEKSKFTDIHKLNSSYHKKLTKEEAEEAYNAWKIKKDKELKEYLKKQKELLEEKEKLNKIKKQHKDEAEKAYEIWKGKNKLEMKQIQNKNNEALQMVKEKQKNDAGERKTGAELSFKFWKKNKDEEINNKIKEKREIENYEKKIEGITKTQRKLEAMEAYNDWLEKIAQRELIEKRLRHHESALSLRNSMPWIPPGKN